MTTTIIENENMTDPPKETGTGVDSAKPTLKQLAIKGSVWTIVGFGSSMVIRLGSNPILAYLLFPEAFGLMALVNVFLMGLAMFSDVGLGPSIIQSQRGDEPDFLNTAWTIQIIRGGGLLLCACVFAWPVAWFYEQSILVYMLPVAGLTALLLGFNSTNLITANRQLNVRGLTIYELGTQLFSIAILIGMAFYWKSVWVLVIGGVIAALFRVVLSHLVFPGIRNRFYWDKTAARSIFHFGKWIFVSTVLTFFAQQADRLILGKLIPIDTLGIYGIALGIAMLPSMVIGKLNAAVLFPVLSEKARQDKGQMAIKFMQARKYNLVIALAIMVCMGLIVPWFFRYLYDSRYWGAGWMAQYLMIPIWIGILQSTSDRALLALGDSKSLAVSNGVRVVFTATACVAGYYYADIVGFLMGMAVGALAGHMTIMWRLRGHDIHISKQDIYFTAVLISILTFGIALPVACEEYVRGSYQVCSLSVTGLICLMMVGVMGFVGKKVKQHL